MRVRVGQLPCPPEGADRVVVVPGAVIVLDGASAFGPAPVSAAAYADCLGKELASALASDMAAPLQEVLASAIATTASVLDLHDDDVPSSTVAIARSDSETVDLLVLGDSFIAYRSDDAIAVLTDDRLGSLRLPQSRRYRDRLAAGHGYDEVHAAILRELQAGQRVRRNTPGGYWIASADPRAAAHAITRSIPAWAVRWIVLATDGAVNTARHLGLDDWEAIAGMDQAELAAFLRRCHSWEEAVDPDGCQFPRSKRHDDKAIAAIARP